MGTRQLCKAVALLCVLYLLLLVHFNYVNEQFLIISFQGVILYIHYFRVSVYRI